ncbi:MAG TPA: cytochrome c3 family protein [Candidatus Dormibacteraeota bacterium]|nr:cytochrome c3 family protein [Candidatus Dormibacteraeota bacterium]
MAQIFHHSTNTIARVSIFGAVILIALLGFTANVVNDTSYVTEVGDARPQPVPFSHKHHVGELGLDCRYCHTSVEVSSSAGMPPTQTCMTCHSQIWTNAAVLEPVRASYRDSKPISWLRVNAVPDFVYFNHSIHIHKGVGCTTCHGPIGQMNITWRANTLYMRWCLQCHNAPQNYLRPRSQVFNAFYKPPSDQLALGNRLMKKYNVQKLTDCVTCHR